MSSLTRWTSEEDKAFENAIALHYRADSDEWLQKIALLLPRKTLEEVKQHYEILVEDLKAIESGLVALPNYTEQNTSDDQHGCKGYDRLNYTYSLRIGFYGGPKGGSKSEQERRKGIPWTEEEHRLFLLGLDKYGKGDWRSISRNYVKSRTPTQVASHAQKYFIRLNSMKRDRRRSSIHDITTIKDTGQVSSPQGHVTGQKTYINNLSATATGSSGKHWAPNMTGVGMYGAPMGCPVAAGSHMVSAVGTPVMLPTAHHPTHPPYVLPVAYPITPNMHQ